MTSHLCVLALLLGSFFVHAADIDSSWPVPPPEGVRLEKIKPLEVLTEIPNTAWETLKFSFQRDSVPVWSGIFISTALIYQYDADILKWAQGQGRRWNLGNSDMTKTVVEVGPYPIFRFPSDTGSALYFLGDGWTHFGISLGFAGYGYFKENTRAWNTGLEIFHGMMVSTIFNQALKRSFGHETPSQRTTERGQWKPFPSVKAYNTRTAKYDAMPSGHIMTTTLVFNTIRMNYPEYSSYIWPVQILWSAALGYQMVNNGVHWASDYPLGIAMGWAVARMSVKMGEHNREARKESRGKNQWQFFPSVGPEGETTMNAMLSF
ncbi:MAG: phosphatase PAP2 family protein [Bdellovibrionales bacterium]|nr:phosphatase PAP2 family protein [Bdellovibrionales bacterium]